MAIRRQARDPLGSGDVLDDQPAQARLGVLAEPADGEARVASYRERVDDLVGDHGGARLGASLAGDLADPGDIAGVGAGMLVNHFLDPVQVVGEPGLDRFPRGLGVGTHRDHQRGRDVLVGGVTARAHGPLADHADRPLDVPGRHDRAEFDAVREGAGSPQHPFVHRPGVHRKVAAKRLEVQPRPRRDRELLAGRHRLAAQQRPNDLDGLDRRGIRPPRPLVSLAKVTQVPQRRADTQHDTATGCLVQGSRLHGDRRWVAVERVDDAEADPGRRGVRDDRRGDGEDAAVVAVLVGPDLRVAEALGQAGVLDGLRDGPVVLQRDGEPDEMAAHHASPCRPRPAATRLM